MKGITFGWISIVGRFSIEQTFINTGTTVNIPTVNSIIVDCTAVVQAPRALRGSVMELFKSTCVNSINV